MPSLRQAMTEDLPDAYENALIRASAESGLEEENLPQENPFRLDQILDNSFLPD